MYIEASRPRLPGETAVLESRMFTPKSFTNGACVSFWYHMNGADIGDLNVYVGHPQKFGTVSIEESTRHFDFNIHSHYVEFEVKYFVWLILWPNICCVRIWHSAQI